MPESLSPPVRRLPFYEALSWLQRRDLHRAVILSGARRVGKTTLLYQLARAELEQGGHAPAQILYATFDHPILKVTSLQRLLEIFVNNAAASRQNLLLLLDEIHYAGEWSLWLKRLVDENPSLRIVATGSASAALSAGSVESGAGRWVEVQIPTLSFYEYVMLRGLEAPNLDAAVRPIRLPELTPPQPGPDAPCRPGAALPPLSPGRGLPGDGEAGRSLPGAAAAARRRGRPRAEARHDRPL